MISAHWLTEGTRITAAVTPEQIYDFYGFPDELYDVRYEAPGSPALAREIESAAGGISAHNERGIDHAAWSVLKHMYPRQDIPVLEMSLDVKKNFHDHYQMGKALTPFREKGVLFIGSGNIVHNLYEVNMDDDAKPYKWAVEQDRWFGDRLEKMDIGMILDYPAHLKAHQLSIPTTEHFLPLLYTLGMMQTGERIITLHESIQNGSVSMRCVSAE